MDDNLRGEQYMLDINWYFADHYNRICVVASGGGTLPTFMFEGFEQNNQFHEVIYDLPERFEIRRNENLNNIITDFDNVDLENYFRDFDSLAKKGLYVYDKVNLNDSENGIYVLVTYPVYETGIDPFPIDPQHMSLIPNLNRALISRTNESFSNDNFSPIALVDILNRNA